MDKEKKTTLEIFKAKATAALKRKREHRTFTISFPSFAQDMDEDGSEGTPLEIKFKTLSDAEINECVAYEDEDDPTAGDKYAVYIASVEPSLKKLGMELKEAGEINYPFEIMKMFERHEITEASIIIMEQSGVMSKNKAKIVDRAIENLKN